jgi:hypothetical protein
MHRSERVHNLPEMLYQVALAERSDMWTALPGFVVKFPGSAGGAMTVDIQPTVNGMYTDEKGLNHFQRMPVLLDCPIVWAGGGGATLTFPITAGTEQTGDEALVIIASRAIDSWWYHGGIQNPVSLRMHDLSDGFAIIGLKSLPRSFAVDTSNVCLTSNDLQTYVKMSPAGKTVAIQASNGINLNGVTIDSAGNIGNVKNLTGAGSGAVTGFTDASNTANTSLTTHYHTAGGPPPIPGS